MKSTLFRCLKSAGTLIREGLKSRPEVEHKSELSLVTATDKAAEKAILEILTDTFPDHAILSEESPPTGNSESRWIIDPIDGTTNFAHTFPASVPSIAYEEKGVIVLGGVYDPFREELFFAERGKGATLNDQPIRVSPTPELRQALIATGFPYDRRERIDFYLRMLRSILLKSQGIRRMGAAAMDLCYVACGRFDGYYEAGLNPWDKAAGMLILEEAGGTLTDFSGNQMTVDGVENVATNGHIHEELLTALKV